MGLTLKTSAWADKIWENHTRHSAGARQVLARGRQKQRGFPNLAEDVHSLLYLRHPPQEVPKPAEWAKALCTQAQELPEWKQLRARCQANGFSTGIATETVLRSMVDLIPEPEPQKEKQHGGMPYPGEQEGSPKPGTSNRRTPNPDPNPDGTASGEGNGDARRALRQGIREAMHAVDEAENEMEGMQNTLGFEYGTGQGAAETLKDLDQVRTLYDLIKDNELLKKIAALAGRLQRLASSYKRTRVSPGIGPIKGITLGGDLPLILPSELIGLRSTNKALRVATLGKVMAKRALQYEVEGLVPAARGPVILCIDKSSSMQGEPEVWAKAVAMSLLKTATDQKRAFHYIGFTGRTREDPYAEAIQRQQTFLPGETAWQDVVNVLLDGCDGGTDFEAPLHYALRALRSSPTMRQADIVFITDGAGRINANIIERVNQARSRQHVHVYAIAIGAQARLTTLQPIADELYQLSGRPEQDSEKIVPVLALVS